jgi:hypothetical protein
VVVVFGSPAGALHALLCWANRQKTPVLVGPTSQLTYFIFYFAETCLILSLGRTRNPFLAIDRPSDHFLLARSARARGACEFPFRSEPKTETGHFPFLAFPLSIPFFKLF